MIFLKKLNDEKIDNKTKQYKIDQYLDNSQKGCYLNGEVLEYLKEFFSFICQIMFIYFLNKKMI